MKSKILNDKLSKVSKNLNSKDQSNSSLSVYEELKLLKKELKHFKKREKNFEKEI
ncbi:Mobile element protein [Mesomycoplasma hyorhinis]|nr:Mobile element protein [Mesomycoplasma hyorhinis]